MCVFNYQKRVNRKLISDGALIRKYCPESGGVSNTSSNRGMEMNNTGCTNVAIFDDNVYFATGLKHIIGMYSQLTDIAVSVLHFSVVSDIYYKWDTYDCIFVSLRNFHGSSLIYRALSSPSSNIILVKDCIHRINEPSIYAGFPTIYRNQSTSGIYNFLRYSISSAECLKTGDMVFLHKETGLSPRECHTAMLLASGASHADIAATLNISVQTVSSHKRNMMSKLRMKRSSELAHWLQAHSVL